MVLYESRSEQNEKKKKRNQEFPSAQARLWLMPPHVIAQRRTSLQPFFFFYNRSFCARHKDIQQFLTISDLKAVEQQQPFLPFKAATAALLAYHLHPLKFIAPACKPHRCRVLHSFIKFVSFLLWTSARLCLFVFVETFFFFFLPSPSFRGNRSKKKSDKTLGSGITTGWKEEEERKKKKKHTTGKKVIDKTTTKKEETKKKKKKKKMFFFVFFLCV